MKIAHKTTAHFIAITLFICLAAGQTYQTAYAASTDLANVPMAVANSVTPNILVILDNSQSMDGYMNGTMVSGNDPSTRSNTARKAMRDLALSPYRTAFNWGLMTFSTGTQSLMGTYVYYLGDTVGMQFTTSCSGFVAPTGTYPNQTPAIPGDTGTCSGTPSSNCGRSPANALWTQFSPTGGMWTWHDSPDTSATWTGNRCIANPQPQTSGTAYAYLTIDYSSDDLNINDVLYFGGYASTPAIAQAWAPSTSTTAYNWYKSRSATGLTDTTWNTADFSTHWFGPSSLTPTDAGFIPLNTTSTLPTDITRSLYLPRGWGYDATVNNAGVMLENVMADSTVHYEHLIDYLWNESSSSTPAPAGTGGNPPFATVLEIKNAAEHTPTAGTLATALSYFQSSSTTPVQYSCQQNFVMLVTDGLPTGTGNYTSAQLNNTCVWNTATNSCSTGTLSQAVQDVITQLTTLRATSVSGQTSTNLDGTQAAGAAPSGKYDIQTYVVGLGDTVANPNNFSALNAMAYNGGGMTTALLATDQSTFETAVNAMTSDVFAKVGSAAAIGVANTQVTSSNNASYASSYNSGTWAGDLNAYAIDLTTGLPGSTSLWTTTASAQVQLDALSYPGGSYSGGSYSGGTYNATNASAVRYIVTSTDTAGTTGGVQFQPSGATTSATIVTKLSASQQALLNTPSVSPADGAVVVAYLRGDRTGEPATYRARAHLLGAIIDAEPVVVNAPNSNYADLGYQGASNTFKESHSNRVNIIYQGSNDGMLHAFSASTGKELWAFIPNMLLSPLNGNNSYTLNNLSSKSSFVPQYRVDGTPMSSDVDFNNVLCAQPCTTESSSDWRTILVGGLGKGGRGYYALDVTSASAASESAVAGKVLWEFPNSIINATARATAIKNTGYSFGKPIIVKTKAQGWVVLVTSGYNNGTNTGDSGGDGLGHLYVLNPKNGDLISDISTTGCNATPTSNPCGLAQINAYVPNASLDATTDYVYGGDLYGNVWRFDLSGSSVTNWSVSTMAVLGATQPITATPELGTSNYKGKDYRFVFVGTGEYLGKSDVTTTQTQTMYGLIDPKARAVTDPLYASSLPPTAAVPGTLRANLVQQTLVAGTPSTITTATVDPTATNGWYLDLSLHSGERVVTAPLLAGGVLTFTTDIPSSTACIPGGSSWLYNLDYTTGGTYTNLSTEISTPVGQSLGNELASRPVLIVLPNGTEAVIVRLSGSVGTGSGSNLGATGGIGGTTNSGNSGVSTGATGGQPTQMLGKRISWHELVQ